MLEVVLIGESANIPKVPLCWERLGFLGHKVSKSVNISARGGFYMPSHLTNKFPTVLYSSLAKF